MKEIKAIIKPFKLDDVLTALHKIEGLPGITISDIRGFGKSKGQNAEEMISEGLQELVPKIKLELVVADEIADKIVDRIQQSAHTGNIGDGKIFVIDVKGVVKIRTNERGENAI